MLPDVILSLSGVCLFISVWLVAKTWELYNNRKRREGEILSHADHQAQHLIEKAKEQALEIISAADVTASDNKRNMQSKASVLAKEQLQEFEENLKSISETIKSVTAKEAALFRQEAGKELATQYDSVLKQVAEYKKQKFVEADAEVNKIVREVFEKIAGKLIPIAQQQELVMQALEEAKKDHVF